MRKQEKVKQVITENVVIEATSPWDGEARFDRYAIVVHKYDNEDLSLMEAGDRRITGAVERIFQLIDPKEWDRLLEDHYQGGRIVHPRGERNARPRGGR